MTTVLSSILQYIETKDFDNDVLSGAIVGLSEADVIRIILADALSSEREMVEAAFDAGLADAAQNGEEYFEMIYNFDDEQDGTM